MNRFSRAGRLGVVLLAAALAAGCDEGINSPDFGGLIALRVQPPAATVQVGGSQAFQAFADFARPPSQGGPQTNVNVTNQVAWSTVDPGIATITSAGVATGQSPGATKVRATLGGATASADLTVSPAMLTSIVLSCNGQVDAANCQIPRGGAAQICAQGRYDGNPTPRALDPGTTVNWSSRDTTVSTVSSATTTAAPHCISANGVALGATVIDASTTVNGNTFTDDQPVTVVEAQVQFLLRVEPPTADVGVGGTQEYVAIGRFNNNQDAPVADSNLNWTTADPNIATVTTVPPDTDGGIATGVGLGSTTVTATLKDGVGQPPPAQRSANATINVIDLVCVDPLLASDGATVEGDTPNPLCLTSAVCDTIDEPFAIDERLDTYARFIVNLGLLGVILGPTNSLAVTSADLVTPPAAGLKPGFLIGRPDGALVSADILTAFEITTYTVDGQGVRTPVQSSATDPELLGLQLLGTPVVGREDAVIFVDGATQPFDGIELTFTPLVATALDEVQIFAACRNTNPEAGTPPAP